MPWIANVAPYETIQSLWGNNIRNRVVHQATDAADYNAIVTSLPVGAWVCKLYDAGSLWQKQAAGMVEMVGVTRGFTPNRWEGAQNANHVTVMDSCDYRRDNGWVTYAGSFHWSGTFVFQPTTVYVDLPYPATVQGTTIGSCCAYDATRNTSFVGAGVMASNGGLAGIVHGTGAFLGAPGSGFDENKGIADAFHWSVRYRTTTIT